MGYIAQRSKDPFVIPRNVSVDPNVRPKYGKKTTAETSAISPRETEIIDIGLVQWVYELIAANAPNKIAIRVTMLCIGCRFAGKSPSPMHPIPEIANRAGKSLPP